jgi:hypothetical protein
MKHCSLIDHLADIGVARQADLDLEDNESDDDNDDGTTNNMMMTKNMAANSKLSLRFELEQAHLTNLWTSRIIIWKMSTTDC